MIHSQSSVNVKWFERHRNNVDCKNNSRQSKTVVACKNPRSFLSPKLIRLIRDRINKINSIKIIFGCPFHRYISCEHLDLRWRSIDFFFKSRTGWLQLMILFCELPFLGSFMNSIGQLCRYNKTTSAFLFVQETFTWFYHKKILNQE